MIFVYALDAIAMFAFLVIGVALLRDYVKGRYR